MHSRLELRDTRLLLLIGGVFAFAFALNLFHHLQYDVMIEIHCDGVHGRIIHVSQYDVAGGDSRNHSHFLIDYVYYAKYTQTLAGVVIPVVSGLSSYTVDIYIKRILGGSGGPQCFANLLLKAKRSLSSCR